MHLVPGKGTVSFRDLGDAVQLLRPLCLPLLQSDRVKTERKTRIGTIEVVRSEATFARSEFRAREYTEFEQANKKDARDVTEGQHTMSTTKMGKVLRHATPYPAKRDLYHIGAQLGRLSVEYRMAHTLQVYV